MNPRTASFATLLVTAGRAIANFSLRFLRNQPRTEHEQRIFTHLNGLVESVMNQMLNRTFAPSGLRVVTD